jgi:hypothetical protein
LALPLALREKLKRRKNKRARDQEGKRTRGQERIGRWEDVKMC